MTEHLFRAVAGLPRWPLVLALALVLLACGGGEPTPTPNPETKPLCQ